ncbi:MAG: efflux RND transporter periplasmic adaptor subunit [Magnetococcales bacterium]|nr:efflux RND transporter periplasmic adaptor subunit [Magnetococcales bacterium]
MSWNKILLILITLGLAGLAAYAGRGYWLPVPADALYKTQPLARGALTRTVAANGTLNPVVLVNVGTQVSGTVLKLHVDFNSRVEKGQVLVEIDPATLQAQIRQSTASMASARAALDLAKANASRMQALFRQEFVSRQEWEQSVQAVKSAQAQFDLARAQSDKDHASLARSIIRSPVTGVVIDRQVDIGQTVAADFQTPVLFRIAQDLSRMQIDANFAEADIGQIHVGQKARFTVDAFPGRSFQGVVRQVRLIPVIQQNVVTYDVVIAVENPELLLMPGMTAYVHIVVAQRDDALLIPNAALRFRPSTPVSIPAAPEVKQAESAETQGESRSGTVYRLINDRLTPVRVGVGITDNRQTEMTAGPLQAGDPVVVEELRPDQNDSKSLPAHGGMRMF